MAKISLERLPLKFFATTIAKKCNMYRFIKVGTFVNKFGGSFSHYFLAFKIDDTLSQNSQIGFKFAVLGVWSRVKHATW